MCRLIYAETYKLFKNRAFKVLCIVAVISALVFIGTAKLTSSEDFLKSSLKGMSQQQQEQFIEALRKNSTSPDSKVSLGNIGIRASFKDMFHPTAREIFYSSFGSGVIEILLSVLIASVIAREYSSGTIKNIIAYGKKREHYYISKLIAASIGFIIILGIMVCLTTIIGTIIFGWGVPFDMNQILEMLKVFIAALIVGLGTISIMTLIATLVKSNGTTIILGIFIFSILPTILYFFYGKFSWFNKMYESIPSYNWALATSIYATNNDIVKTICSGIITLIIFSALGIFIFKKQDIK